MTKTNKDLKQIAKNYLNIMKERHSNYVVTNKPILSDKQLVKFVEDCLANAPSSFNFKTQRMVILFSEKHKKLWDLTKNALPDDGKDRITMFAKAYATILFYVDNRAIDALSKKFPQYRSMFMIWETQANAMLQFQIWTGLSNLGYGVNIQHYNPLIDKKVVEEFNLPNNWTLIAQMPIGQSCGVLPVLEPYSKINRVIVKK